MESRSALFHEDPIWWAICCAVVAVHIGIWCWAVKHALAEPSVPKILVERVHLKTRTHAVQSASQESPPPHRKESMVRQEPVAVAETPAPAIPQASPSPPPKTVPKPKKTVPDSTKKLPAKTPLTKKSTPPKKKQKPSPPPPDPVEEKRLAAEQALLASAAATLSQLEAVATQESAPAKPTSQPLPQVMGELKSHSSQADSSASYIAQVAWKLKKTLRFPEYGSVRVEIAINKEGRIERISVLASENAKNRAYVETTLPTLSFPPNPNKTSITYTFLLNNE